MRPSLPRLALTLRAKLLVLNGVVVGALLVLAVIAWRTSSSQDEAQDRTVRLAEAMHLNKQADMLHDALRSDVLASLLVGQVPKLAHGDVMRHVSEDARALDEAMRMLAGFELPPTLAERLQRNRVAARGYGESALRLVQTAALQRGEAMAALPAFDSQFRHLLTELEEQGQQLDEALKGAQAQAAHDASTARQSLLWTCLLTICVASAFVAYTTLTIRRRLSELGGVAQAIADGDLSRRASTGTADELGALGAAVDRMAESLNGMIDDMRGESHRAAFGKQLADALDMADREAQVCGVVSRAMAAVSAVHPMELLVADSSRAQMERAAEHPSAGAPGCGVSSPYDCVAVRRGTVVSFPDSEALNACDHLRSRPCGAVSAVCVPVTFMGRAIGVLHATGTPDRPMAAEQAQQLGILGVQIGMRIGTVRAFERTQIQAATDSLTGLPNRRTLEQRLRSLAARNEAFAVVMCDLDRFKLLNDTHGRAAGDSALRLFAEVMRSAVRESDLAGRWGGEEFAIVMQDAHAQTAEETTQRLRKKLADALQHGKAPSFTASFGISDSSMSRNVGQLVQFADVALYQAKASGRDRACVADPTAMPDDMPVRRAEPSAQGIDHAATDELC